MRQDLLRCALYVVEPGHGDSHPISAGHLFALHSISAKFSWQCTIGKFMEFDLVRVGRNYSTY